MIVQIFILLFFSTANKFWLIGVWPLTWAGYKKKSKKNLNADPADNPVYPGLGALHPFFFFFFPFFCF